MHKSYGEILKGANKGYRLSGRYNHWSRDDRETTFMVSAL